MDNRSQREKEEKDWEGKILPDWLLQRYLALWEDVRDTEGFTLTRGREILNRSGINDDRQTLAQVLSEMRRAGWSRTDFDPSDNRRKIYHLVRREDPVRFQIEKNGKRIREISQEIEGLKISTSKLEKYLEEKS